jgi:hypothetical protein
MKKSKRRAPKSLVRSDRRPISVRRWWGNGESEATVKLTRPQWRRICAGDAVDASTWAWYEGKRQRVGFWFNHSERGRLHIGGKDGADHYRGTLAEAQITGAEFPPCPPDATQFTVHEGGTLEMAGITLPETRAEAYDLSPRSLRDAADLISAAETCEPLCWYLDQLFEEVKAGPKPGQTYPNPLAELHAKVAAISAAESDLDEWLSDKNEWGLEPIITGVQAWLREEPDWVQEDDHIPPIKNAQGAALAFFQNWDGNDLEALYIVMVEGAHPGSTYYAAELHQDPSATNLIAWQRDLPVWFAPA